MSFCGYWPMGTKYLFIEYQLYKERNPGMRKCKKAIVIAKDPEHDFVSSNVFGHIVH